MKTELKKLNQPTITSQPNIASSTPPVQKNTDTQSLEEQRYQALSGFLDCIFDNMNHQTQSIRENQKLINTLEADLMASEELRELPAPVKSQMVRNLIESNRSLTDSALKLFHVATHESQYVISYLKSYEHEIEKQNKSPDNPEALRKVKQLIHQKIEERREEMK